MSLLKKGDLLTLTEDYEIVISPPEMTYDVFAPIRAGTIFSVQKDQIREGGVYGDFTEVFKSIEGVADNADPIQWISEKKCAPVVQSLSCKQSLVGGSTLVHPVTGVKFDEENVTTFMGGKFTLDSPKTVKELADQLNNVAQQLREWTDKADMKIGEVHLDRHSIDVTLKNGIVQ